MVYQLKLLHLSLESKLDMGELKEILEALHLGIRQGDAESRKEFDDVQEKLFRLDMAGDYTAERVHRYFATMDMLWKKISELKAECAKENPPGDKCTKLKEKEAEKVRLGYDF